MIILTSVSCDATGLVADPVPEATIPPVAAERNIRLLPLQGLLTEPEAEISGLAWFQDVLILLPQYPHKWNDSLYGLHRHDIARVLAGEPDVLEPFPIPLSTTYPLRQLEGYEGLEAIAFDGHKAYLAVEARMRGYMQGYLLEGVIQEQANSLHIALDRFTVLEPQTRLMNQAYESLFLWQDRIVALYEANGMDVNPHPSAPVHDRDLNPQPAWSVPVIEYRLTDATAPDDQGLFWVINFYWPGDKRLLPATDALTDKWGEGKSHAQTEIVERILAMRIAEGQIELMDMPPVELALLDNVVARNWEGIVRWDEQGFLIVTDQFPTTLLAYVPR